MKSQDKINQQEERIRAQANVIIVIQKLFKHKSENKSSSLLAFTDESQLNES